VIPSCTLRIIENRRFTVVDQGLVCRYHPGICLVWLRKNPQSGQETSGIVLRTFQLLIPRSTNWSTAAQRISTAGEAEKQQIPNKH